MKTFSSRSEQGYSLVELMVVLALVGIIATTAISSYGMFRERAYDTAAESDFTNVLKGIYALSLDDSQVQGVLFFGLLGPRKLPPGLSQIGLTEGVRAQWIIKIPFVNGEDLIFVSLQHVNGGHMFRAIEFFGTRIRQKIPI